MNNYVNISKGNIFNILLRGLLVASLSFMFLVVSQKNFKSSIDFLVVQDQTGTQDFYSLFKSAEYISNILSTAIYSEVFIDEIIATGRVDENFFSQNQKQKIKKWKKTINVERNTQSGLIKIDVFGDSKKQTMAISEAIMEVMQTKNYLFRGKVGLDVRVLSGPIVEKNPGVDDIVLAIVGGFMIGAIFSFMKVYYVYSRRLALEPAREENKTSFGISYQ